MYSQKKWLISLAFACTAFGLTVQKANAQSNERKFEIVYDTLFTLQPIEEQEGFFTAQISGISQNSSAAFGLTQFESNAFGKLVSQETVVDENGNDVPVRQNFEFNADPSVLGLENVPDSVTERRAASGIPDPASDSDIYFGDSDNKLFGQAADRAEINFFPPGSPNFPGTIDGGGTITITGGSGAFENASGEIVFEQSDRLPEDQNAPAPGVATLFFTVLPNQSQEVPEPTGVLGLATGIAIGASVWFSKNL
jgi:hypothetical protein